MQKREVVLLPFFFEKIKGKFLENVIFSKNGKINMLLNFR